MVVQQKQNILSVTAVVISIIVGAVTILGLPKCYDFETKAEAASNNAALQKQIDRIEDKIDKILDTMLKSR